MKKLYTKHNKSNTPEYRAWAGIKNRCNNPNTRDYHYYGGRGITVSDDWVNSFHNFLLDMGMRPNGNYSIDRIDNNKNYTKDNCRWASKRTQVLNRRTFKNNSHVFKGMSKTKSGKWQARIKNNGKLIALGTFLCEYDAAIAYNAAAIVIFGKDAILNKTDE